MLIWLFMFGNYSVWLIIIVLIRMDDSGKKSVQIKIEGGRIETKRATKRARPVVVGGEPSLH